MSTVAARLLLVIESLVFCGYVLAGSVVIFCVCAHYLDRGLWSCPGGFFRHVLGLRSSLGSVFISWIVDCGHVLDGSVVIYWVCGHFMDSGLWSCPGSVVVTWACGHFLARGLWSCLGWVCRHLLGLWSFPDSWFVVMSWLGLWSSPKSVIISWLVVCGHVLGLWSSSGSVIISWVVVCGHVLRLWSSSGSVFISSMLVCGHVLGLW